MAKITRYSLGFCASNNLQMVEGKVDVPKGAEIIGVQYSEFRSYEISVLIHRDELHEIRKFRLIHIDEPFENTNGNLTFVGSANNAYIFEEYVG